MASNKAFFRRYTLAAILGSPLFALAVETPSDFRGLVAFFIGLIQTVLPVIGAAALLAFFLGLARFIRNVGGGGTKAVDEGKQLMLWGVVILFVMVSVYAILNFFHATVFGGGTVILPQLPS